MITLWLALLVFYLLADADEPIITLWLMLLVFYLLLD